MKIDRQLDRLGDLVAQYMNDESISLVVREKQMSTLWKKNPPLYNVVFNKLLRPDEVINKPMKKKVAKKGVAKK